MKIILTTSMSGLGGTETATVRLGRLLKRRGHDIILASSDGPFVGEAQASGIRWQPVDFYRGGLFGYLKGMIAYARMLRREQPDIIDCQMARVVPACAVHLMLDIFKKMVDRDMPVRLNVAGIGEEMDNLKAQAERLGIDGKVTFLGGIRDLTAYFKDVDILVNTPHCIGDHGAGVGNNILEAGLYDTPVVTYDMAGISEMVVNGETGYCIPFGDEEAFIAAVDTLVRQPELREAMGKRLHAHVAALCSDDEIYRTTMAAYTM